MDVIGTHVDQLGECPVWDSRLDSLYTIDIDGRSIHRTDPTTGALEARNVAGRPGSIALTADVDILLVATPYDTFILDEAGHEVLTDSIPKEIDDVETVCA